MPSVYLDLTDEQAKRLVGILELAGDEDLLEMVQSELVIEVQSVTIRARDTIQHVNPVLLEALLRKVASGEVSVGDLEELIH